MQPKITPLASSKMHLLTHMIHIHLRQASGKRSPMHLKYRKRTTNNLVQLPQVVTHLCHRLHRRDTTSTLRQHSVPRRLQTKICPIRILVQAGHRMRLFRKLRRPRQHRPLHRQPHTDRRNLMHTTHRYLPQSRLDARCRRLVLHEPCLPQ